MRIKITDTSAYLPSQIVSNAAIESRLNAAKTAKSLPEGVLERLFGCQERRFATENEQVSDIAAQAALPIVLRQGRSNIDCLIFAAACGDLLEPATANIIQVKLGLNCPVFDLKNACNSFVTAIQVGTALIQSGQYRNVLVVNGEKLQDAIQFEPQDLRKFLAAYTLGDAGAAVFLESSTDESGFVYQKFKTRGQYWDLCTVPGGGSMHPHTHEFNYFQGKTSEMKQAFMTEFADLFENGFQETGWKASDIQHFLMHQVSMETFDTVAKTYHLPRERFIHSFNKYGNIAAATIPVNLHEAVVAGKIKKGDKLMFIGLGAGISVGLQLMIW